EWEGFETGTEAAIWGGITTMVDMPLNSLPVTTSVEAFDKKIAAARNKIHTNIAFWGGLIPGNESQIEPLIGRGVLGFKAFLTHSGIDEFPNVTEADLRRAMPLIAQHNLPLLVHCELTTADVSKTTSTRSYAQYLASRPKEWEDNAIEMMIRLCEAYNCRVHIVHLSSANSIDRIAKAKAKGLPLTVETAQHYLYFNAEEIADGATELKCAPPIRERENNEQLWHALADGTIDFVATDHSPSPPELKELQSGDFTKAWGGISSVQLALPILWTAAKKRGLGITDVVKWLCEKPAGLAGIEGSKGKIEKGFDADFIVVDTERTFKITADILKHKHKVTPYLNNTLYGVVEQTYLAGVKVFDKENVLLAYQGKILTR
ncbi:MAG TPA: allantoinase AllB, partial [Segetibacter sp.]